MLNTFTIISPYINRTKIMKKNKILGRTIIIVLLASITFFTCNPDDDTPPECPTPTELELIDMDSTDFDNLTYQWTEVPNAIYEFTLNINGMLQDTTLNNNSLELTLDTPLEGDEFVTAEVKAICENSVTTEAIQDTFTFINPLGCSAPVELGLIWVDTIYYSIFAYEWTEVPDVQEYVFTFSINGVLHDSISLSDNNYEVQLYVNELLYGGEFITAEVQAVCENGVSEAIQDGFTFIGGGAAVEVIYLRTGQTPDNQSICDNSNCQHMRLGRGNSNTFCDTDVSRFMWYHYDKEDFCDCATKSCESGSITDCLKTIGKWVYRDEPLDCY